MKLNIIKGIKEAIKLSDKLDIMLYQFIERNVQKVKAKYL